MWDGFFDFLTFLGVTSKTVSDIAKADQADHLWWSPAVLLWPPLWLASWWDTVLVNSPHCAPNDLVSLLDAPLPFFYAACFLIKVQVYCCCLSPSGRKELPSCWTSVMGPLCSVHPRARQQLSGAEEPFHQSAHVLSSRTAVVWSHTERFCVN